MSAVGTTPVTTIAQALGILTTGWSSTEAAIITGVSGWSFSELIKLGTEELQQCWQALTAFVAKVRAGVAWGTAMASMLTEVWNDTKSDLAQLATDFVEAVGKVFQNVGLLPASA